MWIPSLYFNIRLNVVQVGILYECEILECTGCESTDVDIKHGQEAEMTPQLKGLIHPKDQSIVSRTHIDVSQAPGTISRGFKPLLVSKAMWTQVAYPHTDRQTCPYAKNKNKYIF